MFSYCLLDPIPQVLLKSLQADSKTQAGQCSLGEELLEQYFQALKALNPDSRARLHLDCNGTLLTPDYVDELVQEGGVTDIGVEPKAVEVTTFVTRVETELNELGTWAWMVIEK